jgi:3-deoxy-7-phosphoheptulonate synthase
VRVGSRTIRPLTLIAGPCAVEGEEPMLALAHDLKRAGVDLLRGGAYKPRSSPWEFQGLGPAGLRTLSRMRDETGLPVVTEAVDEASLEQVERHADVIQIGARNMQNFSLLRRAGRSRLPVLLKRGFSATLEELLLAAEYVVGEGNPNVVLCERGIRSFSDHSRYTLDLAIVPRLKRLTHLPVIVDPSHASGIRQSVAPLARAAVAVGADGVMIEVHPDPLHALCDGPQSLVPGEFAELAAELRALARHVHQATEAVS